MGKTDIYVCVKKCYFMERLYDPSSRKKEDRIIIVPAGKTLDSPHFKLMQSDAVEVNEPKDVVGAPEPTPMSKGSQIVSKQNRITLIVEAIGKLDPVLDYWHGKPKVKAIERDIGMNIAKEERDAALHKIENS